MMRVDGLQVLRKSGTVAAFINYYTDKKGKVIVSMEVAYPEEEKTKVKIKVKELVIKTVEAFKKKDKPVENIFFEINERDNTTNVLLQAMGFDRQKKETETEGWDYWRIFDEKYNEAFKKYQKIKISEAVVQKSRAESTQEEPSLEEMMASGPF